MKTFLKITFWLIVSIGAYHFYTKPHEEKAAPEQVSQGATVPLATPSPQVEPLSIAPILSPPTPPTPRPATVAVSPPVNNSILPNGKFILLVYQSVTTSDEIKGYPPGTMLTNTKANNQFVTEDGNLLTLLPGQATDNLDVASAYISADRYGQLRARELTKPVVSIAPSSTTPAVVTSTALPPTSLDSGSYNKKGHAFKMVKGKWVQAD